MTREQKQMAIAKRLQQIPTGYITIVYDYMVYAVKGSENELALRRYHIDPYSINTRSSSYWMLCERNAIEYIIDKRGM